MDSPSNWRQPDIAILDIISSLSPRDGGPPEVARQLAATFAQNNSRLEILCNDSPDADFLKGIPCPVHAMGQRWLGKYSLSPRMWRWLKQNIQRFDGVVIQGIWTFPGWVARVAALKAGKRYAVFPHGSLDPWFKERYPLKHIKKLLYWPFQYPVLRDATAVLFTSAFEPGLAKQSFRPNQWNAVLFPQGIAEPAGDPTAQKDVFYAAFPQVKNRRFLLFMSRLHAKKGCDLLIDAFSRVAADYPDVDLMLAGPDQHGLQAKLQLRCRERGIGSRVHWPGMIAGDLKWGALRSADAFILPSHQENFGLVVVESLAAGRPVLTTNKVNICQEILADGAALVEDDTVDGTLNLLRVWLDKTPEQREEMASRSYPCFAARFRMQRGAQTILQLFENLEVSDPSTGVLEKLPGLETANPGEGR